MTRILLAATALAFVAVAPAATASPEPCLPPGCVPCQACIGHVDPCDIVRCTPPCILGVTC